LSAPFPHLHVRSGFSYGYGAATLEELVGAAAATGVPSLAREDQDGLCGIPRFLRAAGEAGVSPVVGAGVSIFGGGHLVLLAEGMEGHRSLCKLVTAYRISSGDRRSRPTCPLPVLLDHADGLLCLTRAVPFGLLPGLLLSGRTAEASGVLRALTEAFNWGAVCAEFTDGRTAGSRWRMARVAAFAGGHGVPILAGARVPSPRVTSAPGAFVRAGRRGRRAG